jgi:hypothetical protein
MSLEIFWGASGSVNIPPDLPLLELDPLLLEHMLVIF